MVCIKQDSFFFPIPKELSKDSLQIRSHSLPGAKELYTACEIPTHYLSSLFKEKLETLGKSKISQTSAI